ncbi:MAG: FecR family protein [Saprospiraceae bacterium]
MNIFELELLEKWQADPSFINWLNQVNEADIAKWDAYFKANPQYVELADIAIFSKEHFTAKPSEINKQRSQLALQALQHRIAKESKKQKTGVLSLALSKTWRIAATFLLLVSVGLWAYGTFNAAEEVIVWTTQKEKKDILLKDGTAVILNKNSTLSYVENDVRNVQLVGEAFFTVTKKPIGNIPFTVTTEDLVVQVLGTQFNVNTTKEQTSVYLEEGKIQLALGENQQAPLLMEPGYLVRYAKNQNKVLENKKADALENTAWKEKFILFEESTLSEILEIVTKVYGVNFKQGANIKSDQTYTGGIPVGDLDFTIKTLKELVKLDIQKIEATYLIENR